MKSDDFFDEKMKKKVNDACRKRLNKIMPIYVEKIEDLGSYWPGHKQYYCYYKENGIVKYALILNPYMQRYGPNVVATLKGTSPSGLWQKSKGSITDLNYNWMLALATNGKINSFPVLNLDEFKFES